MHTFPIELQRYVCNYLNEAELARFTATCSFFHQSLAPYKRQRRQQINDNLKYNNFNCQFYTGPNKQKPDGIVLWKHLIIAVTPDSLWAWDIITGKIDWHFVKTVYLPGSFLPTLFILDDKLVCPIRKRFGYESDAGYVLVLDAKTGRLHNNLAGHALLSELTLVEDSIITKTNDGTIECYDSNLIIKQRFQSSKHPDSVDSFVSLLATPCYLVDIKQNKITIINRLEKTTASLCIPNKQINCASIYHDQLICGFTETGDPDFVVIDLRLGQIILEYNSENDILNPPRHAIEKKLSISSIIMRNKEVFFIFNKGVYWANLNNRKPLFLEEISTGLGDNHLSFQGNYLFIRNDRYWEEGTNDLSIWNLKTMQKITTIKPQQINDSHAHLQRILWRNNTLFTNFKEGLCKYDFNKTEFESELTNSQSPTL